MISKRAFLSTIVMAGAAAGFGIAGRWPAVAQTYPSRPVQLLVPFSSGNVVDLLARAFAQGLSADLGQPVVVLNHEGASGTLAFAAAASAAPDGYTLVFGPNGQLTIQPHLHSNLPYRADMFDPICQTFENQFAIIVGPHSPIKDFNDLIARARAKSSAMTFGTGGIATVQHLLIEALAKHLGVKFVNVPYRVYGQIMQDVIAGRLDFAVPSIGSFDPSSVRALVVLGNTRSPIIPDVPTLTDLGLPVTQPGFGGLYAPKAAPKFVHERLAAACAKAFATPLYQQVSKNTGSLAAFLPSAKFAARLAEDSREKGTLIKELGITIE